jgi:hypothetical protein
MKTKEDLIQEENERHEKYLQVIEESNDEFYGRFDPLLELSGVRWTLHVKGLKELHEQLTIARRFKPFELEGYYHLYKDNISVHYKADEEHLTFYVEGDEDEIIEKLSNGKCKITEETYKCQRITCER